jgi:disulfide oxidoreductase YuzD
MGAKKDKKAIKKKYSEIAEKMKMLQICNNAILESIIQKMIGKEEFTDKTTNGDLIYSGMIFQDILVESCDENNKPQLSEKTLEQLTELIILCEKYQYVMVIDNPQ